MRGAALTTAILLTLTGPPARAEEDKKPSDSPRSVSEAATFTPTSCLTIASPFSDVLSTNPQCPFIRELFNDGISGGCAAGKFCPENPVNRGQLAVFLERVMRGASSWDAWTDGPVSPTGLDWGSVTPNLDVGTMMEWTTVPGEASGIYFDGDSAILWSPGDGGLLRIFDQDQALAGEVYRLGSASFDFINKNADGNQKISFFDQGTVGFQYFGWNNTREAFDFSGSIFVQTGDSVATNVISVEGGDGALKLTANSDMALVFDSDTASPTGILRIRAGNGGTATDIARFLASTTSLDVNGAVTANAFDLAETFLRGEPLGPGDVVRVDPRRPNAIVKATQAAGGAVLGVISTKPGVSLGGALMDDRAFDHWGADVKAEFFAREPALRQQVIAARPDLRPAVASTTNSSIHSLALQLFAQERLAPVALSGRVPVKVDASLGAIHVGDPITASPIPGIAMLASRPGPILGTALEALETGRGKILMFVNRGWWGGTAEPRESSEREHPEATQAESSRTTPEDVPADRAPLVNDPYTLRARGGGHAEVVPVSETVEEGDVLVMDDFDAYRPSVMAEDATVVGVVAARPALLSGRRVPGEGAAVVVSGMTTVKVDASWGAIQRGDLLVSSPTRGHAMRADDPPAGTILGKALEAFEGGTGTIRVLVMLR